MDINHAHPAVVIISDHFILITGDTTSVAATTTDQKWLPLEMTWLIDDLGESPEEQPLLGSRK